MENEIEISVWNMEDAKMEWKISRTKWKTIFHSNSILDFRHGIYKKNADSDIHSIYKSVLLKCSACNHLLQNNSNSTQCKEF